MDVKTAGKIIKNIHDQNGDSDFYDYFLEVKDSIEKFDSFQKWDAYIQLNRTDLSQDMKWELECFSESFIAIFALLGKTI